MDHKKICQCCGVPLDENVVSHEKSGDVNEDYCKWCYHDGVFTYHNMRDLIEACIPHMTAQGFNEEQAREYMENNLPLLKYWSDKYIY